MTRYQEDRDMSDTSESVLRTIEPQDQTAEEWTPEEKPEEGRLGTLTRLSLGAVLLAVEALSTGLRQVEEQEASPAAPEERPIESVLIPAEEWDTALRHELESPPRQVALGFALDARSRLTRTAGAILRQGNRVVGTVDHALSPVLGSRAFSPARGPFERLVERGQAQIKYWRDLGRAEEAHSRALVKNAAEQTIDTTVDTVSSDPRTKKIVQEIVQQQSLGMADEAIEEVRERTVTGDMLLERPVRSILRRRPRESVPASAEIIRNLPKVRVTGRGES
jgi:hypothetical protein